jgi:hypothetical protein
MKVGGEKEKEKTLIVSIFFCGYLLKPIIKIWRFKKTILQNLANLGFSFSFSFFAHEKFFVWVKIFFFHAEISQQFASKRNTARKDSRVSVLQGIL